MKDIAIQGIGSTSQRRRDALVTELRRLGIENDTALELIRTTPRHLFLDEAMRHNAYYNRSVPIGHKQTMSQPYTVARMTGLLLENAPKFDKVLEIGTGSGYQTAVLAQVFKRVYSVERIAPLQRKAQNALALLNHRHISFKIDDGQWGWPMAAPFDAIISAASPEILPTALLEQLAVGGCLVSPVGGDEDKQRLFCVKRTETGFEYQDIEAVTFVPFLSGVQND